MVTGSTARRSAPFVAVDQKRPQWEVAMASVNPTNPIQNSAHRSALETGTARGLRPRRATRPTIGHPRASRRKARVIGPRSSTVSRTAT